MANTEVMSSKDIKTSLKLAKEFLDKKDVDAAIIHCKKVLKSDRSNYMALVLFGACLQENGQLAEAPKAFKKATLLAPDQPLAWKGLASFYEKQNNATDRSELLQAYQQLLKLENDNSKIEEWVRKIGILLSLLTDEHIAEAWNYISHLTDEKKTCSERMVFSVLASNEGDAPDFFMPIMEYLLNTYKGEECRQNSINVYKKYLKLIYKMRDFTKLLEQSKILHDRYPEVIAGPEWYCRGYLEGRFDSPINPDTSEPSDMYITLLKLAPDSFLGYTCKGVDELACQELVAACETLIQAVALKPTYGIAWYLLTQSQIWLHRFGDAEKSAREALNYWKPNSWNKTGINNCKFWLAKALCEQNDISKWVEALRIADEFLFDDSNNLDFLPVLVKVSIKLGDKEKYDKYMALLEKESSLAAEKLLLNAYQLQINGETEKSLKLLEEVSESTVNNYEIWLQLGILYYEQKNAQLAMPCLLKATKLNQWCHTNFCYLGHCYKTLLGDLTKARRCYQKAFQLNPTDKEAGIGLSDVYRLQGLQDENMTLLTVATQDSGARWAWLKLGLHYLSISKPVEAVSSLRVAVRLDSNDKNVWESLGDAYLALGSFTAAVKSYQKVLEWGSDQVYPLLQIATVKHLMELDEESVQEFRQVLRLAPDFLPALRGHAISCLSLMRYHLSKNLNGLAADRCQEAVDSLVRALKVQRDLISAWKLLNDACFLISKLPSKYCSLRIPSSLWIGEVEEADENIVLTKGDILQLGVKCCCQAIALCPDLPELWYDLAGCYHSLADTVTSAPDKKSTRLQALSAVKWSLKLKPDSWSAWNLLGLLSMMSETKNHPLAQHSFVKAIQLDEENPIPWSNLGSLYLSLGDLKLANQCFTEAQRCDPDFIECWVGQAMLAEQTGHHEAMDLYRHSTQLGFHPEGALGYSSMVLTKIIETKNKTDRDYIFSIKNMNAVPTACDAILWYTDRYPNSPCAFNMLGLLMERMKLYRNAVDAFQSALSVLTSADVLRRDQVLHNYGRALLKVNDTDASIAALKEIKEATFTNQCTLAAAYIKADRLEEAYSTYESTLEWLAPNDESRGHVLVAMAAVVYSHQGHEDAKLLLMQACQLKPISVAGLFACCGLGLLHSDLGLTELALKELVRYCNDSRYLASIALFQAYTYLLKGKNDEALRTLCKTAHRHPADPTIWLYIALLQLHLYPDGNAKSAAHCSLLALSLGRSSIDVSKVTSLVSLSHLLAGCGQKSLQSAQKAVRLYPDIAENWVVLVAAVLARVLAETKSRDFHWLKEIITHVRRRLEASRPITQWLSNSERKVQQLIECLK